MLESYLETSQENPLRQIKLVSGSTKHLLAKPIGYPAEPKSYHVQINTVASGQRNQSKYVSKKTCPFTTQTYSFSVQTNDEIYDFELPVHNHATNESILLSIQKLINQTVDTLEASILEDKSRIALVLEAKAYRKNVPAQFSLREKSSNGILAFYELNSVTESPKQSDFSVDGKHFTSYGTAFNIDDLFELTLLAPSPDTIIVSYELDSASILSEAARFSETVNQLLELSKTCSNTKLYRELLVFFTSHHTELEKAGLQFQDSQVHLSSIPDEARSLKVNFLQKLLSQDEAFSQQFLMHTQNIIINPMEYVPNKIVSYKDFTRPNFPNPYETSMYSGFLFTNCC
jgi:flagellar hook-associated protein 2